MAKFSAYMRGEGGPTGNPAGFGNISVSTVSISSNLDAEVIIDSITSSPNEAKDFDFLFKIPRGVEAGISANGHTNTITYSSTATKGSVVITASGPDTEKVFNFKFTFPTGIISGTQNASIHPLNSSSTPTISITTDANPIRKKLYFDFGVPVGKPAGFGNISISTNTLPSGSTATVVINSVTTSPETAKDFDFYFGIPKGVAAGIAPSHSTNITYSTTITEPKFTASASGQDTEKKFTFDLTLPEAIMSGTHIAKIQSLNSASTPTVSITTDNSVAQKKLYFNFGIPAGMPAGFDEPIATIEPLSANSNPTVSITTSGPETKKIFNFKFGLPTLNKAGYEISFSTANSGTGFSWNGTTLKINRTLTNLYTGIIPINIYKKVNNDYKAIAADFEITNDYIQYNADVKFEGYIHCISV